MSNLQVGFFNPIISSKKEASYGLLANNFVESIWDFGQQKYKISVYKSSNENKLTCKELSKVTASAWKTSNFIFLLRIISIPVVLVAKIVLRIWNFGSLFPTFEKAVLSKTEAIEEYKKAINVKGIGELFGSAVEGYSLLKIQMDWIKKNEFIKNKPIEFLNEWPDLDSTIISLRSTLNDVTSHLNVKTDQDEGVIPLKLQVSNLKKEIRKQNKWLKREINRNLNQLTEAFDKRSEAFIKRAKYDADAPQESRILGIIHRIPKFELMIHHKIYQLLSPLRRFASQLKDLLPFIGDVKTIFDKFGESPVRTEPSSNTPAGIKNIHNSCYMNADMQAILNTPYFKDLIIEAYKKTLLEPVPKSTTPQIEHLQEALFNFMNVWETGSQDTIEAAARHLRLALFSSEVGDFASTIDTDDEIVDAEKEWTKERERQQDAAAFFELVLSAINYNYKVYQKFYPEDDKLAPKVGPGQDISMIQVPVVSNEPTDEIDEDGNIIYKTLANTAQELLQKIFEKSELSDDKNITEFDSIDGLNKKSTRYRESQYLEPPKVLVMHMKRFYKDPFTEETRKYEGGIPFPDNDIIKLSAGQNDTENKSKEVRYRVTSFVEHSGSTGDVGHYISWVNKEGTWYRCEDSEVTEASAVELREAKNHSYLYVLEKVQKSVKPQ